ncbi:MobF family relaxase (plasmid) [Tundrisphaera sp. TA3]|uniref:MobF family relaxase n=1 Tax=Tundrisphaera sp. TA3 TaxID=3435775 RepID=UPI003EBA9DE2
MLSIAALSGGPDYYLQLTSINYYSLGGEPLPIWAGTAARELGLFGNAQAEHVQRLCAGFDAETGTKRLVRNAGDEGRNPGHDLTFSCPKSVSVAWAIGDEATRLAIQKGQLAAVKQAIEYLEDKAGYARVGSQGQSLVKAPLLLGLFEHGTSRALDPQLHTHAVLINLTVHPDGRTTAVDSTFLYHVKMAAGAIYRAALADQMQKLGFQVEQRPLGSSIGFELAGIPSKLIEEFSKRRAEIEAVMDLRAGSLDASSAKYAELIAKETRRTKETEKPRAELIAEWKKVGLEFGVTEAVIGRLLKPHQKLTPEERAERKEKIYQEAVSALSENYSHWNETELTKAVAERSAGRISARDVRELMEQKLRSPELISLGPIKTESRNTKQKQYIERIEERFTTPEIRRIERQMLQDVEFIVRGPRSGTPARHIEAALKHTADHGKKLDPEQAKAVQELCSGPGVRLLRGVAGSGKTTTLKTCVDAWRREDPNRLIWGCAVAGAAMQRLKEGVGKGIDCETLQSTLYQLDKGRLKLDAKSVVLVDEAGMLGTNQLAKLIEHVKKAPGARLILVGDDKQLQPISAGGPFKYLASVLGTSLLTKIRRQDDPWARDAVKAMERGDADAAIKAYINNGRFHLAKTRPETMDRLLEQWKADGGIKDPTSVFMLASTNSEVKALNVKAQAARILCGEVDPEKKFYANGYFIHQGDKVQFQKRSKPNGLENSDCGTVTRIDNKLQRVTFKLDKDGREVTVDLKKYSKDNLRLGYASTTHKLQGASLPHVHVLIGGSMTDQHMGYVQLSRSIKSTHLFCDEFSAGGPKLANLIRSLGQARYKTMAQEVTRTVVEQTGQLSEHTIKRGYSISR